MKDYFLRDGEKLKKFEKKGKNSLFLISCKITIYFFSLSVLMETQDQKTILQEQTYDEIRITFFKL